MLDRRRVRVLRSAPGLSALALVIALKAPRTETRGVIKPL